MSIKGSKDAGDRFVSKQILSQKWTNWIDARSQVNLVKKAKTCPHCGVTNRKPQTQITKKNLMENRGPAESAIGLNTY